MFKRKKIGRFDLIITDTVPEDRIIFLDENNPQNSIVLKLEEKHGKKRKKTV